MKLVVLIGLLFLQSCSSKKAGYASPNQSNTANNSGSDSDILQNILTQKQKENKIKSLLSKNYLSPAEEAELSVLKKGGSQREAFLAAKKYNKGLSDFEADELKYLEEGKPPREALLRAKEENRSLSLFEKKELDDIKFGAKTNSDDATAPLPDKYSH